MDSDSPIEDGDEAASNAEQTQETSDVCGTDLSPPIDVLSKRRRTKSPTEAMDIETSDNPEFAARRSQTPSLAEAINAPVSGASRITEGQNQLDLRALHVSGAEATDIQEFPLDLSQRALDVSGAEATDIQEFPLDLSQRHKSLSENETLGSSELVIGRREPPSSMPTINIAISKQSGTAYDGNPAAGFTPEVLESESSDVQEANLELSPHFQLSSEAAPAFRVNINSLPAEIVVMILSYLDIRQLLWARRVTSSWRHHAEVVLSRCTSVVLDELMPIYDEEEWRPITEQQLHFLLRLLPNLEEFNSGYYVDGQSITNLHIMSALCPRLISIDLTGGKFTSDALVRLGRACGNNLQELVLDENAATIDMPAFMASLTNLEELRMQQVPAEAISQLPWRRLRILFVTGFSGLDENPYLLSGLSHCCNLVELYVKACFYLPTLPFAEALAGLPELELLTLQFLATPLDECLPPGGLPRLRFLDVAHSLGGVMDDALQLFSQRVPHLRTLVLCDCDSVTNVGLEALGELHELKSLYLFHDSALTADALHSFTKPPLRQLHLEEPDSSLPFHKLMSAALSCSTLEVLALDREVYGSENWASWGEFLTDDRDLIIYLGNGESISLREWSNGRTMSVWPRLERGVSEERYEKWF